MKDILSYYAQVKESTSSYFYYKRADRGVMKFLFDQNSGGEGAYGDLSLFFRNAPKFITSEPNEMLKKINKVNLIEKFQN
jgi:hypothetical protein